MKKKYYGLIVLFMLICPVAFAEAQVSIGIGLPNLSIGINLPLYPQLTPVPGYPVYYAPEVDGNYFFYDGMYWVYQEDNWYASSWYNGPWAYVEPTAVPVYVLRIPVRYYRQPPVYFRGWQANAPPRWGQHWGHEWEQHRRGWNKWNRSAVPARAPRPAYQKHYSGDRYPRQVEQQHAVRGRSYRYQPRDRVVRQHYNQPSDHGNRAPAQRGGQAEHQLNNQRQQAPERSPQHQQGGPAPQGHRQQPGAQQPQQHQRQQQEQQQPQQHQRQQQEQQPQQHQRQQQEQRQQERGNVQEPDRGRGQDHSRGDDRGHGNNKDDDRGRGRDK